MKETEVMHMKFTHETELDTLTYMVEYLAHRIQKIENAALEEEARWDTKKMIRIRNRIQSNSLIPDGADVTSYSIFDRALKNPDFAHVRNAPDGALIEWLLNEYVYDKLKSPEEIIDEVEKRPCKVRAAEETVQLPIIHDEVDKYALPQNADWVPPGGQSSAKQSGPVGNVTA